MVICILQHRDQAPDLRVLLPLAYYVLFGMNVFYSARCILSPG